MINLIRQSFQDQFNAALCMLQRSIEACPEEQWEQPVGGYPFWQSAYHILFYLDFYLTTDSESFVPQEFHRQDAQRFGVDDAGEPIVEDYLYDKETLLAYVKHCQCKISESLALETEESLTGPSGFAWYKITRFEFHINNIRHVQHHAAQLSIALRRANGTQIGWIGSGWKE